MNNTSSQKQSLELPNVMDLIAQNDHEQLVLCQDNKTGLRAIIAIHNTVLGPGLGGTRMWTYANDFEAVNDALRLSRGMTYKAAISKLNLGGAKAVIIGNPKKDKSEALMRKFGRFVENLNGKYITAEDVGTTTKDMEYIKMETDFVTGLPEIRGGGGDPSPVTAYGVYMGMKAAQKKKTGNDSLMGQRVLVQGIGKVGFHLLELLYKEEAKILVSDINHGALEMANTEFNATVVNNDNIFDTEMDIFAPCALGAVLNSENINKLKCSIVAGAANNQLAVEEIHGPMLKEKGILYAPDFVINAGGLINVYSEFTGYQKEIALQQTEEIYETTLEIFAAAEDQNTHTQQAANILAEMRIESILQLKSTF